MQRRAAAGYVTLFLLIAAGAYVVANVTTAPTAAVEEPDYELSTGDEFGVDGRTYSVRAVEATVEEGGEHASSEVVRSATLTWRNDSAGYAESWEAGGTVEFDGLDFQGARLNGSYDVVVPNVSDPTTATLRAAPENLTTREQDGVTYVERETEDGSIRLVPIDQYDPLQRVPVEEGTVDYRGNRTTVTVTESGVGLSWTAPRTETVDFGATQNVTLNGQRYFTYFPDNATVFLTQDASDYRASLAQVERYHEREDGLWGIALVSAVASILLVALAFLPRKDV